MVSSIATVMTTGVKGQIEAVSQSEAKKLAIPDSSVVTIHRITCPDVELLAELAKFQERIFSGHRHNRLAELLEAVSLQDSQVVYLARRHGQICGFVFLKRRSRKGEWVVRGIGVDRSYRRRGVGSALLARAIAMVKRIKGDGLVSYVDVNNRASLRLHERMGFASRQDPTLPAPRLRFRMVFSQ